MVEAQVALFPEKSVTVRITEFAPPLRQLKVELFNEKDAIPQLSPEPLLTWEVVILAFPVESRYTVTGWQTAPGILWSAIVTRAEQVEVLAALSETVKVTVTFPMSAQVKEVRLSVNPETAQLSLEPLLIEVGLTVAVPFASNEKDAF